MIIILDFAFSSATARHRFPCFPASGEESSDEEEEEEGLAEVQSGKDASSIEAVVRPAHVGSQVTVHVYDVSHSTKVEHVETSM